MPDNAFERHNHDRAQKMDEIATEIDNSTQEKRGSAVASNPNTTMGDQEPSLSEMMGASAEFDVEVDLETETEDETGTGIEYELENEDIVERLDNSYVAIAETLETQSWEALENNPLYDDGFISSLETLCRYIEDEEIPEDDIVISVPENEKEEIRREMEGLDYVVSLPGSEIYNPEQEVKETLGALSTEDEKTGARLELLDMYAHGADIEDAAQQLGDSFENIYEADQEFRDAGLLDNEGLTEKGQYAFAAVFTQYEEMED